MPEKICAGCGDRIVGLMDRYCHTCHDAQWEPRLIELRRAPDPETPSVGGTPSWWLDDDYAEYRRDWSEMLGEDRHED